MTALDWTRVSIRVALRAALLDDRGRHSTTATYRIAAGPMTSRSNVRIQRCRVARYSACVVNR